MAPNWTRWVPWALAALAVAFTIFLFIRLGQMYQNLGEIGIPQSNT